MADTTSDDYARRLEQREFAWWKRLLNVQAPYQWNLRRQGLGRTLEIGCGIGRNLQTLGSDSVGVDHNSTSVRTALERGHTAFDVRGWESSELRVPEAFDSLLVAHVIEHMDRASAKDLLIEYLPYLRSGGQVFMVCPQEKGFASDPTHVDFTTGDDLEQLARAVGLVP